MIKLHEKEKTMNQKLADQLGNTLLMMDPTDDDYGKVLFHYIRVENIEVEFVKANKINGVNKDNVVNNCINGTYFVGSMVFGTLADKSLILSKLFTGLLSKFGKLW